MVSGFIDIRIQGQATGNQRRLFLLFRIAGEEAFKAVPKQLPAGEGAEAARAGLYEDFGDCGKMRLCQCQLFCEGIPGGDGDVPARIPEWKEAAVGCRNGKKSW